MDPKKNMTPDEVKMFFSATHEFTVVDADKNLKISYKDNGDTTSLLIWKKNLNAQQLIRTIHQLVWNHCNNIFD